MSIGERFGENLLILRRRTGLSQEQLGQRASLHRTEISQLERGVRLPRIDTLVKLAGALRIEPQELLKGIAWLPNDPKPGRFGLAGTPRAKRRQG